MVMTGFEPEPTHYRLTFEDPKLRGLEVTVAGLSIGEFEDMTGLAERAGIRDMDLKNMTPEDVKAATGGVMKLLETFAESLVSWNLTRRGEPVPADLAGVRSQELGFVLKLVAVWMSAVADVDIPLPGGSPTGATSPEESLRLASSSRSLAS